ncbi:hypothetical protein K450DRAFT_275839 [Umbelopsis ramanniana AG]|uniref:Uncharacterized protein n=1 Tax=Umbelopsis ramanniana AG TaxID=1314678 RepID=A0AAD5E1U5_UMBRA|nr:uncharacterized protein K450DRAFT_275839 [Umbelopsis ramanniana AG]KAI8575202.1 hypothetical protein K450DRAFT_275839 [Umbelopsis ramanniana AG]
MSVKSKKAKVDTEGNEVLQTQIDVSVNLARDLVNSWLPPVQPGEESDNEEEDLASYTQGRPGRIGLGAKFLSHNQATRHNQAPAVGGPTSASDIKLRNKILNQNATVARKRRLDEENVIGKMEKPASEDDDEDSKTATVKSRNTSVTKSAQGAQKPSAIYSAKPKKIENGDFLSMYLTEREGKKKKKKKKKNTSTSTEGADEA